MAATGTTFDTDLSRTPIANRLVRLLEKLRRARLAGKSSRQSSKDWRWRFDVWRNRFDPPNVRTIGSLFFASSIKETDLPWTVLEFCRAGTKTPTCGCSL